MDECVFDSLADFEAGLAGMGSGPFREHAQTLAPLIVPGTQEWKVYRVIG